MPLKLVQDDRPVALSSLSIGAEDGRRAPIGPVHFRFRLDACVLDCRFEEVGATAVLTVACPLGRLPPPRTSADRHAASLRALEAAAASDIRIRQRHGGVIVFSAKRTPPAPVTASRLLTILTGIVLPARPWLALFQDILDPPP